MKPVMDEFKRPIKGLFRQDDGSLSVIDREAFLKAQLQKENFASMSNEINTLKAQMKLILEKLNDKS